MVQFAPAMGQQNSMTRSKGWRSSFRNLYRRSSKANHKLSHTFAINDNDQKIQFLNINLATEEELMTLDGINRFIAKNIVEHRKAIGRFRKVEDLALVSGIGAVKLELIRPEICVVSRKTPSCASSRTHSYDSLRSGDSRSTMKSNRQVNVNKASVFELQLVNGITQELAAAIVSYREKKGPFKTIEDLTKVKKMDHIRLNNLHRYLTIEDSTENSSDPDSIELSNCYLDIHNTYLGETCNGDSFKNGSINGLSTSVSTDIFELLCAYSTRPVIAKQFRFVRNGEPAIRIATWNLENFSFNKASNLGVKEVLCRTILENGWSIIAIQDVLDVTALRSICEELNKPKLRRIDEWKDKNHSWNFAMVNDENSRLGFIYDCMGALRIDLTSVATEKKDPDGGVEILLGYFTINDDLNLEVLNVLTHDKMNPTTVQNQVKSVLCPHTMSVVCGDFNTIEDNMKMLKLKSIFKEKVTLETSPTSEKLPELFSETHAHSDIFADNKIETQLTGFKGIVNEGLTHLAIPNGWSWGGRISSRFPSWVEIFTHPNAGTAL